MYRNVFRLFKCLITGFLHTFSDKAPRVVVGCTGIRGNTHEFLPVPSAVTGLFQQFTLCRDKRRGILLFTYPGTKFNTSFTDTGAVLFYQYKPTFLCDGDDI